VELTYELLPAEARDLCERLHASPRLVAHLTLVHDTARRLIEELRLAFPEFVLDADRALFGAATHDLGKTQAAAELTEGGKSHQAAGRALLLNMGVPEDRARFAWTHGDGNWNDPAVQNEDLVVALADKIWKGKRISRLEELIVEAIARASGKAQWQVFFTLDEIIQRLASNADERLAWQAQFPAT
jgi:hypothetical protein